MRQVFAKEWRQGQMIALFGLLMGGLITALWGILTVAYGHSNWQNQQYANAFCGVMYYIVPIVLAIFVGSGLFAAEVERGTLPLLLALPFSRRQVWLGKLLAGLALVVSAVALVIIPGAIAVRPALQEVDFWTFLPDLALASLLLYVGAVLWSTVYSSIVSAFLSTIALAVVLFIYAVLMLVFGGRLLGPPLLDAELWALSALPAIIAGSYIGFVRGELFKPKRRWVAPVAAAAAVYLVTTVGIIGLARWGTRYDRSRVEHVHGAQVTGGGAVVSVLTDGSRVELHRSAEIKLNGSNDTGYRRDYAVCLDLKTGREALVRREGGIPVVSPDGKYAALLTDSRPITWRGETSAWQRPIVEIWDLPKHRMVYRGVPRELAGREGAQSVTWSPDGKWLGFATALRFANEWHVMFMRPDGSGGHGITVAPPGWPARPWDYAPSGDAVYALQKDGSVARFDLKTGEQTSLWDLGRAGTGPEAWDIGDGWLTSSPDGREVAVALTAVRPVHQSLGPGERTRHLLLVLAADGSSASVTQVSEDARSFFTGDLAWSGDGRTLYFVSGSSSGRLGAKMRATVWRAGTGRTAAVTLPGREGLAWTAVLPDGRLFLWSGSRAWMMDPDGRVTRLPTSAETALADSNLAGVDRQGRLIVGKWKGDEPSYLAALDLNTGKLTRIYP